MKPGQRQFTRMPAGPSSAGVTNALSNEHKFLIDIEIRGQGKYRRQGANAALKPVSITITPAAATMNAWLATCPPFAGLASSRAPTKTCTPCPRSTGSGNGAARHSATPAIEAAANNAARRARASMNRRLRTRTEKESCRESSQSCSWP